MEFTFASPWPGPLLPPRKVPVKSGTENDSSKSAKPIRVSAGRDHRGRVPLETIEEIRSLISIELPVGESVSLRRSGSRFLGLCPFHSERTPSFTVNIIRQRAHCFGCGWDGDIFEFISDLHKISFRESVAHLAARAGVSLEGHKPSAELRARIAQSKREREEREAFERWADAREAKISARYRGLARAATRAARCLSVWIPSQQFPDLQELAWSAIAKYRRFQEWLEREEVLSPWALRAKYEETNGRRDA